MTKRHWRIGVILGAFLIAVMIMALPRVAAAWGGFAFGFHGGRHHHTFRSHHEFVHPYRDFVSRHRFFDFDHRFVRNRLQIQCIQRRFPHTPHSGVFRDVGNVPQGLHLRNTLVIFRR